MFSGCVAAVKAVKKLVFWFECNRDDDGKDAHTLTTHPLEIAVNQVPLATLLLQGRKREIPDGQKRKEVPLLRTTYSMLDTPSTAGGQKLPAESRRIPESAH